MATFKQKSTLGAFSGYPRMSEEHLMDTLEDTEARATFLGRLKTMLDSK